MASASTRPDMAPIVESGEDVAETAETGQTSYSIGELAQEFGLTLRALRFYEAKGLISPRRRGLERIYGRRDRARLKLIVMGKRIGFSLAEIKEMLDLYDLGDAQVDQLRTALAKFRRQVALLEQQKRDVEQALAELNRTVAVVAGMLEEREGRDPA